MAKHAIILCGGKATRLGGKIKGLIEIPNDKSIFYPGKPKRPPTIIELQINRLAQGGVDCVWLATQHGAWTYRKWLGEYGDSLPIPVDIIDEKVPLGTGGAIKHSIQSILDRRVFKKDRWFFIYNGDIVHNDDTLVARMLSVANSNFIGHNNCLAGYEVPASQATQYGQIEIDDIFRVKAFKEKQHSDVPVWINAGLYLFDKSRILGYKKEKFSIERDYFEPHPQWNYMMPMREGSKWLDVGTEERLQELKTYGEEYAGI